MTERRSAYPFVMQSRLKYSAAQKRCLPFVRSRNRRAVPGVLDLETLVALAGSKRPEPEGVK